MTERKSLTWSKEMSIAGTLSDPDYQNFPNYLNDLTLLLGSMYFWTPRKCTLLTKMVNLTKTITNSSEVKFDVFKSIRSVWFIIQCTD